jgi:hypothetical protein
MNPVRLRSVESLDIELAWRHVLHRAGRPWAGDVPDRLPFEVMDRVTRGSPSLAAEHHLRPVHLVMATKASGVFRPFVRMSVVDLLLYQALVDALAADIEHALGPRDRVFAYRQDLSGADNPFEGSPSWRDFMASIRSRLDLNERLPFSPFAGTQRPTGYVLATDIASFFIYIDVDELERRLLAISDQTAVVRDLGAFLRGMQQLGVRGLPQGLPPSSPLGNFYLSELDRGLVSAGVDYRRYMDDTWMFVDSYAEARRLQDHVERVLYEDRLSLGGDKVRIRRTATAQRDAQTAEERLNLRRQTMFLEAAAGAYDAEEDVEIDAAEIDEVAVHDEYDELLAGMRSDEFVDNTRSRFIAVYRALERGQDSYAIREMPEVLTRLPDLTAQAVRYVASAGRADADAARDALLTLTEAARFHRDSEWVHICRAFLRFPDRPCSSLADRMSELAASHDHPLVRARALLAWGAVSTVGDFSTADAFWTDAEAPWRPYVLVAIQGKERDGRNARYDAWSGEERFLRSVADHLRAQQFRWSRL